MKRSRMQTVSEPSREGSDGPGSRPGTETRAREKRTKRRRTARLLVIVLVMVAIAVASTCVRPEFAFTLLMVMYPLALVLMYCLIRICWLSIRSRALRVAFLVFALPVGFFVVALISYGAAMVPTYFGERLAQADMAPLIRFLDRETERIGHPPDNVLPGLRELNPGPLGSWIEYYPGRKAYAIKIWLYKPYTFRISTMYSSDSRTWERQFGDTAAIRLRPRFTYDKRITCSYRERWTCTGKDGR